jgi:hypothetical protein
MEIEQPSNFTKTYNESLAAAKASLAADKREDGVLRLDTGPFMDIPINQLATFYTDLCNSLRHYTEESLNEREEVKS